MTLIKADIPANLFVQQTAPKSAPQPGLPALQPGQLVPAQVVRGAQGQLLLAMQQQQFPARSERELQVGQSLRLQVLKTEPQLEFRVLSDPLPERLPRLLPLLTRPYDWGQWGDRLRQPAPRNAYPAATQLSQKLDQLLRPQGGKLSALKQDISALLVRVQNLPVPVTATTTPAPPIFGSAQPAGPLSAALAELVRQLDQQLPNLLRNGDGRLPAERLAQVRSLVEALPRREGVAEQLPEGQLHALFRVLYRLTQARLLPAALTATADKMLQQLQPLANAEGPKGADARLEVQLEQQLSQLRQAQGRPLAPQTIARTEALLDQLQGRLRAAPVERPANQDKLVELVRQLRQQERLPGPLAKKLAPLQVQLEVGQARSRVAQTGGDSAPLKLAEAIQELVQTVRQEAGARHGMPPELAGRLDVLLSRLQQLTAAAGQKANPLPGLDALISQLAQLTRQPLQLPPGEQLGVLAQLFGFYLERELAQGKQREALASLKLSLLDLKQQLGEEVSEPLRRLELFQLCKVRLAEEQVQFLPLPFPELEEGYLLAERQARDEAEETAQAQLKLSLSLRLSALGNLRIDLNYAEQGLQLRLACEGQEKMAYLQDNAPELKQALQAVALRELSFANDARLPAKQLQERLLPDAVNMLDARV